MRVLGPMIMVGWGIHRHPEMPELVRGPMEELVPLEIMLQEVLRLMTKFNLVRDSGAILIQIKGNRLWEKVELGLRSNKVCWVPLVLCSFGAIL